MGLRAIGGPGPFFMYPTKPAADGNWRERALFYRGDKTTGRDISTSAHRLDSLLRDLLAYSELANKPEEAVGFCDTDAVLAAVMLMLEVLIRDNNATITHDPLPGVAADFNEVLQLFQNLIDNALKYKGTDPPPHPHLGEATG
jgi:light-regulated signal transduction histidine kinase (bacteriophytochrome)